MLHYICNRIEYLERAGSNYQEELNTIEDMLADIHDSFVETMPPKEDRAMLMYASHRLKLARFHAATGAATGTTSGERHMVSSHPNLNIQAQQRQESEQNMAQADSSSSSSSSDDDDDD